MELTDLGLSTLHLTPPERVALTKACPYFPDSYLDYLSNIHLDPDNQVKMAFHQKDHLGVGEISIEIEGPWKDCILYEVPIMSIRELHNSGRNYGPN